MKVIKMMLMLSMIGVASLLCSNIHLNPVLGFFLLAFDSKHLWKAQSILYKNVKTDEKVKPQVKHENK